jgi:predicted Zn-dependent protease
MITKLKLVSFFMILVALSSCNTNWKQYISIEIDKEIGNKAQLEYDLIYKSQILDKSKNEELYKKLNLIKERILKTGQINYEKEFDWELKIIDDTILNAFCLPGGKIYVFTGLIEYLDNEAQLAGVMAHEIAHADKRHAIDNMAKQMGLSVLVSLIFGDGSSIINIAQSLIDLKFSRSNETQADEFSVKYLYETSYDASEANGFFEKLEKEENKNSLNEIISTHPAPDRRKEKMLEIWKNLGGKKGEKFEKEYQQMKSLLPSKTNND